MLSVEGVILHVDVAVIPYDPLKCGVESLESRSKSVTIEGYIAGRLNVVSKLESKGIATFVGTFALPSLIFLSLAQLDFSTVNWSFLLAILLAKGLVFFGVLLVTLLVSKPPNFGQAGMFAIFCTQSNDFALGYPIINALYEKTHPEYALYLYLMAPISLAILNPVAFVLMELNKQREILRTSQDQTQMRETSKAKMLYQIFQGILFNPLLMMTVLGIIGNIVFKHKLSIYIEGLLDVFGQSFSASALFLLGLRMVGQITRLRGPALILPCVLIMILLAISAIWGGPDKSYIPSWNHSLQQSLQMFSIYSCLLWTAMLSVGLFMLEYVVIVVTTGSLILYIRFRRRSAQFASLAADVADSNEASTLVNPDRTSHTHSVSNYGCYGAITATPSPIRNPECCTDDPDCGNGHIASQNDLEDIVEEKECACPESQRFRCSSAPGCQYLSELERAASSLGLLPPEQSRGRGCQLLKHTVLIIAYSLTMFIGVALTMWRVLRKDESGVFIELQFLDTAVLYGQPLVMLVLFGLNPDEILIPAVRYFQRKWHGGDSVVLPHVEDLSFETKHVCDQFITHHLERCKQAIRYRLNCGK
ncbi:unnamed protein product [Leptidea sinapis]|uniref:Integral membrane protein GPR155 n=1 Tax=Leptidea sinapis TaxID=189913 RepID=A0A5E4Q082_9NEOP|nr:unnamed protein product [Leptidea sinapis]